MITPFVIQIVFWLSVVGIILFGLYNAYQFITNVSRLPGIAVAIGGLTVLFGPPLLILFARVYAEVIIVFFRIHETLVDIKYQNERDD